MRCRGEARSVLSHQRSDQLDKVGGVSAHQNESEAVVLYQYSNGSSRESSNKSTYKSTYKGPNCENAYSTSCPYESSNEETNH